MTYTSSNRSRYHTEHCYRDCLDDSMNLTRFKHLNATNRIKNLMFDRQLQHEDASRHAYQPYAMEKFGINCFCGGGCGFNNRPRRNVHICTSDLIQSEPYDAKPLYGNEKLQRHPSSEHAYLNRSVESAAHHLNQYCSLSPSGSTISLCSNVMRNGRAHLPDSYRVTSVEEVCGNETSFGSEQCDQGCTHLKHHSATDQESGCPSGPTTGTKCCTKAHSKALASSYEEKPNQCSLNGCSRENSLFNRTETVERRNSCCPKEQDLSCTHLKGDEWTQFLINDRAINVRGSAEASCSLLTCWECEKQLMESFKISPCCCLYHCQLHHSPRAT